MTDYRKAGRIAKHQLQANSSPFSICNLQFAFCNSALPVASATKWAAGSLYAPDVTTVYVPMIDSDSYRRDLGERLTEAVIKEIELKTPYKVVEHARCRQHPVRPIAATRGERSSKTRSTIRAFRDRAAGRSHLAESAPSADRAHASSPCHRSVIISQTSNLIPEAGQSVASQQQQAIERLAQQIVSTMEAPW